MKRVESRESRVESSSDGVLRRRLIHSDIVCPGRLLFWSLMSSSAVFVVIAVALLAAAAALGLFLAGMAGFAVLVPAGTNHNIINTGSVPLKLYTLYAPPNHRDGVVHHTRGDAEADNEHFDGKTTE